MYNMFFKLIISLVALFCTCHVITPSTHHQSTRHTSVSTQSTRHKRAHRPKKATSRNFLSACRSGSTQKQELHTFRTQDLSFPRTKGPYGELSFPRNESSRNFRSRDLSFPGPLVPGNFRSRGTKVPGNFRSHYPIGPVASLLCVLNYCMFGCDFSLMMLTPLWTSQLTLYVGRPAFAARLSVFDVPVTVSLRTKRFR